MLHVLCCLSRDLENCVVYVYTFYQRILKPGFARATKNKYEHNCFWNLAKILRRNFNFCHFITTRAPTEVSGWSVLMHQQLGPGLRTCWFRHSWQLHELFFTPRFLVKFGCSKVHSALTAFQVSGFWREAKKARESSRVRYADRHD